MWVGQMVRGTGLGWNPLCGHVSRDPHASTQEHSAGEFRFTGQLAEMPLNALEVTPGTVGQRQQWGGCCAHLQAYSTV